MARSGRKVKQALSEKLFNGCRSMWLIHGRGRHIIYEQPRAGLVKKMWMPPLPLLLNGDSI